MPGSITDRLAIPPGGGERFVVVPIMVIGMAARGGFLERA
jgi:hypothetical protein